MVKKAFSVILRRSIHISKSVSDFRILRAGFPNSSVGFVPTMGALHEGHLALVQKALEINNKVVVSIFVNPTQFSPGEDLEKYPRTLERDLELLKSVGADLVFLPTKDEMYPERSLCHVEPIRFRYISEGKARPEFFRGVATIVRYVTCSTFVDTCDLRFFKLRKASC